MAQNPVHDTPICPELQAVIDAWPRLSEQTKATIKAIIQAAK